MLLTVYLTVCVFTILHAVPDQTWNAITKVEDRVNEMQKNNDEMEKRFKQLEQNNDKLKQNNDEMEKRLNEMVTRMDQLQSENLDLRNQMQVLVDADASSSPLISFTAVMTSGYFVPGGNNIVPFNEAISNPGLHFDETTYKFTCPSDSMYFFMFSLYSGTLQDRSDYEQCGGSLVLDGETMVEALGRTTDANLDDFKQVTNSAVIFCARDLTVYITAPMINTGIYGARGTERSTFSGFIL